MWNNGKDLEHCKQMPLDIPMQGATCAMVSWLPRMCRRIPHDGSSFPVCAVRIMSITIFHGPSYSRCESTHLYREAAAKLTAESRYWSGRTILNSSQERRRVII